MNFQALWNKEAGDILRCLCINLNSDCVAKKPRNQKEKFTDFTSK